MIKVTNVSKSFGSHSLFENISFQIHPREKVGIVGRNGHGKSTLFKMILDQEQCDDGEISIPDNYKIGYLEQHINFTKKTILEEAAKKLPKDEQHDLWKAEKMLFGLGFTKENLSQDPHTLSGGFQIRLNLAKILLQNTDMLMLDEPTNYLDILSLRWLAEFLKNWKGELCIITHDRGFMDKIVTHTLAIHRQKIKKMKGSTRDMYKQIKQEESIHEKTRLNEEKKRAKNEKFIREFRAGARSAGLVQSRIKTLEKLERKNKLEKIKDIQFRFSSLPFFADLLMKINNISFHYDKNEELFKNLSLEIKYGDKIGIVGKNGKGKSTLLKVLKQELIPQTGTIKEHHSLKRGYFGQTNKMDLDPKCTVLEEIINAKETTTDQQARNICGSLMFNGNDAYKKIEVLSGGEKSRVCLGKMLLSQMHLLLLDEPTNHFDLESCLILETALKEFEGAICIVSHNEELLKEVTNKLIVFENDDAVVLNYGYREFLKKRGWEEEEIILTENKPKIQKLTTEEKKQQKIQQKKIRILDNQIQKKETEIENFESEIEKTKEEYKKAKRQGAILKMESFDIAKSKLEQKSLSLYQDLEKLEKEKELILNL